MSELSAYRGEVAEKIDNAKNIAQQDFNLKYQRELMSHLYSMKTLAETKEREFYSKLGISNYTELESKVNAVSAKYDCFLPDGAIMNEIHKTFDFSSNAISSQLLASELEKALNDFFNNEFLQSENQNKFFNILKQSANFTDALLGYLTQYLSSTKGITIRTQVKTAPDKIGLGKIMASVTNKKTDVRNIKKGQYKQLVEIKTDQFSSLSPAFRKKIEEHFKQKGLYSSTGKNTQKIPVNNLTKEQYREEVNFIIRKYCNSLDLFSHNHYDLFRNISSTIGYLGEIRATLILKELAPDKANLNATGNLKDAAKKREIPIDIVCKENGFQIKNYSLDNKRVNFSHSLSASEWVNNRLKLTGSLAEILIELFGVYQYNQPLPGHDIPGIEEYWNLYNEINDVFQSLKLLYDFKIPEALRMWDEFSVDGNPIFNTPGLYINTFFWINNRLLPSSLILEKLITTLTVSDSEQLIRSSYRLDSPDKVLSYQKFGSRHRKSGIPYTSYDAAKRIKVSYDITLDLSNF